MPNGLLTDRGKRMTALLYAQRVSHMAFGNPAWPDAFNPPLEDFNAAALQDEFGRAPIEAVRYLIADPLGTITFLNPDLTTEGPYRYATPTEIADAAAETPPIAPSSFVEFQATIPENVANGEVIGEIALMMEGVTSAPGWASPGQVTQGGVPLYLITIPAKTIEPNEEITRRVAIRA